MNLNTEDYNDLLKLFLDTLKECMDEYISLEETEAIRKFIKRVSNKINERK